MIAILAGWSEPQFPLFAGANTDHFIYGGDEYLSVADLACFGCMDDGVDSRLNLGICHDQFDLQLGQKFRRVFGSLVEFNMAPLVAAPLDFRDGHAFDSQ